MIDKNEEDLKLLKNFADICKRGFNQYDQVEEGYAIERLIARTKKLQTELVLSKLHSNKITINKARELLGFPRIENEERKGKMNKIDKIYAEIAKLEREKMGYLEVEDTAGVKRKEKKIAELEEKLELIDLRKIKAELKNYKDFISARGLKAQFQDWEKMKVKKE